MSARSYTTTVYLKKIESSYMLEKKYSKYLLNPTSKLGESKMRLKQASFSFLSKVESSVNKKKIATIAFILLLALSSAGPFAFAKTYTAMPNRTTSTAVGASPNLIGLGQTVLMNILTFSAPNGPTYYGQNYVNVYPSSWINISCTITLPDGTTSTFMPTDVTLQSVGVNIPGAAELSGTLEFSYTPTAIGNYTITASFPGQTFTTDNQYANMNLSVYYEPSTSKVTTFTVQSTAVNAGLLNGYPFSPLPNAYWTNPVFTNNREWSAISGAWVQQYGDILGTGYNLYSTAPTTPHILWTSTPDNGTIAGSGLVGGQFGSLAYAAATGGAGTIILDGNIYQNDVSGTTFECISLTTGQVLWHATGQIQGAWRINPPYQTSSQANEGGIAEYLWGSSTGAGLGGSMTGTGSNTWVQYSPADGHVIRTFTNVPTDLMKIKYQDGSPIFWITEGNQNTWNTTIPLQLAYGNLICWNYSKTIKTVGYTQVNDNNWMDAIQWNVSFMLPTSQQVVSPGADDFQAVNPFPYDAAGVVAVYSRNAMQIAEGFSEATGQLLWVNNNTVEGMTARDAGVPTSSSGPMINIDGQGNYAAYNVANGQQIWSVSPVGLPWGLIPGYQDLVYNNGVLYAGAEDGYVYALNVTTGKTIWQSDYIGTSWETPVNNQEFDGGAVGANGILYFSTYTQYSNEPRPRFHEMIAINQTTGKFLWTLPIEMNPTAIAYGDLVAVAPENGIQYCLGAGPTATTVTGPTVSTTTGASTLIQGTVMDMSPGQTNTPAVSDASMSTWMDYLHGQDATLIDNPPTNITGVPVTLSIIDPNGNWFIIGNTTTNAQGHFAYSWTPTIQGVYTVTAAFTGSGAYYSSTAQTALSVVNAQAAAPTGAPQSVQLSSTDIMMYMTVGVIAIIIAIAIVGVLILRKRP